VRIVVVVEGHTEVEGGMVAVAVVVDMAEKKPAIHVGLPAMFKQIALMLYVTRM
jgi:hypothetical protein